MEASNGNGQALAVRMGTAEKELEHNRDAHKELWQSVNQNTTDIAVNKETTENNQAMVLRELEVLSNAQKWTLRTLIAALVTGLMVAVGLVANLLAQAPHG